eukprot:g10611.t1
MGDYVDPRGLIFLVTRPPPRHFGDVQLVFNRVSRHWSLIRGLIDDEVKARTDRSNSSARQTATLFREVVTRLSLSLEAVDTKDKLSCVPGVGEKIGKVGGKHLASQVTARNPKHLPPRKTFVAAPAAILVAMSREAKRRAAAEEQKEGTAADTSTLWLTEGEVRALAAPLCEEDLSHRGDKIILGEVENFGWGSMAYLLNEGKFGCVKSKDLDEKSTIAKLEKLGKRLVCSSPGCNAYATKSMGELSDRVKLDTFRRSVYCKEHYGEAGGGGGKRKKAAGKGKGKGNTSTKDLMVPDDDFDLTGGDVEMKNPYSSSSSFSSPHAGPTAAGNVGGGTGKIKASWYRRLLGEALLAEELDRVEAMKGVGASDRLAAYWRRDFAKKATSVYALTYNGEFVAERLEVALKSSGASKGAGASSATPTATASPILNRSSYASCSERDGGGGGGTAASLRTGHSPLAPARAFGAAKPGVRLLVDNREKGGATAKSQMSELSSILNSRRVPYEVREWKVGDYGWVVQPEGGKRPTAREVSYERELLVPRLIERKRVDDLAASMKDGRLASQKKRMLRAKEKGFVSDIEIHVEGGTQERRFGDYIYGQGLTPDDLDAALRESERHGFKVVRHRNFVEFSAYLADATTALQRRMDEGTLGFDNFSTWQNFVRHCVDERGGRGAGRGRPPPAEVRSGLRQRTLDETLGVAGRARGPSASRNGGEGDGGAQGVAGSRASGASAGASVPAVAVEGSASGGANDVVSIDDDDDDNHDSDGDDDCSVVEAVGDAARPDAFGAASSAGGNGGGGGRRGGSSSSSSSSSGGGGSRGKRKATAEAGCSPFTIAAAGGYSPAAAAAPPAKVRRAASLALSSPSKPATTTASSQGSTPPTGGASDAQAGGSRSGWVGLNPSRISKWPRLSDESGGGMGRGGLSADTGIAPGGSSGKGEGGGGSGTVGVGAKTRSLSFADDEAKDEPDGPGIGSVGSGGRGGGGGGSGASALRRGNASLPASSCPAEAVVDLSADSPSPPPPPRSQQQRQQQDSQRRQRNEPGDSRKWGGSVVLACSSDDDDFNI